MKIKTWADPVIRVNKTKEENFQSQLARLNQEINAKQQQQQQAEQRLQEAQQEMQLLMQQTAAPHTLAYFLRYKESLRGQILQLGAVIASLQQQGVEIQKSLKKVAQQRILLEGIQKKHVDQALQKMARQEELFVADITQATFIEEQQNEE